MWKTAEILILRHQLSVLQRRQPRRPKLDWADRALLAALLGVIPKARRQGLRLLITPDTIVRWNRDIVRRRWAARSACGRTGRPATRRNIRALVRRLARENPDWEYRRIHGELAGLGIKVAASTVWEILKASGIDPGRRQTGLAWSQFLRSQAEVILACDFFTVDLLDGTQAPGPGGQLPDEHPDLSSSRGHRVDAVPPADLQVLSQAAGIRVDRPRRTAKIGPDPQPLSGALMPGQNRPLLLNPRPCAHPGPPPRQQLTATLSGHDQHQAQTRGTDST
jgi:transposase